MVAVRSSLYPGWVEFWDALEEAEVPWARTPACGGREAFQLTVESMVRASVSQEGSARLRELWSSLGLPAGLLYNDGARRWNVYCTLPRDPHGPDDKEARDLLAELQPGDASADRAENMARFVGELKYTALATLWRFTGEWSPYLATLPRDVLAELRTELFVLAMVELLHQAA